MKFVMRSSRDSTRMAAARYRSESASASIGRRCVWSGGIAALLTYRRHMLWLIGQIRDAFVQENHRQVSQVVEFLGCQLSTLWNPVPLGDTSPTARSSRVLCVASRLLATPRGLPPI